MADPARRGFAWRCLTEAVSPPSRFDFIRDPETGLRRFVSYEHPAAYPEPHDQVEEDIYRTVAGILSGDMDVELPATDENPIPPVTFEREWGVTSLVEAKQDHSREPPGLTRHRRRPGTTSSRYSSGHPAGIPDAFDMVVLHCLAHDEDPTGRGWDFVWHYIGDPPSVFCGQCGHVYGKRHRPDRNQCARCPCQGWEDTNGGAERRRKWSRDAREWTRLRKTNADEWLNQYVHHGHWLGGSIEWDVTEWITLHAHFDHGMQGEGDLIVEHMNAHGEYLDDC